MSTDLVSWLRSALSDVEREVDRDEPGCNCRDLGCHHTEARDIVLRSVAAHRAILDAHRPVLLRKGSGADYYITALVCASCGGSDAVFDDGMTPAPRAAAHPCITLRHLASIYESRPGFDPSWRADP